MITLYHGSNVEIEQIDLTRSKKGKDFGCGFYLNANEQQASDMAERTARRLMSGNPIVNAYTFDDSILKSPNDLNIKVFDDYSVEWADFVLMNRKNNENTLAHPYDIVIGPIANDTVGVQIRRYIMGYISIENLIKELRFRGNHAVQYFFGTEKAINLLKKVKV
ncbi:MAG: hypothetical protein H6Q13_2817 [Bacteroidetes bacterium]|nr:hypothetical protein [Bacteroidota bacterium]